MQDKNVRMPHNPHVIVKDIKQKNKKNRIFHSTDQIPMETNVGILNILIKERM